MSDKIKRPRIRKGLIASSWRKVRLNDRDLREKQVYKELHSLSKSERALIQMRVAYSINSKD
jgi:hypothetical protein